MFSATFEFFTIRKSDAFLPNELGGGEGGESVGDF